MYYIRNVIMKPFSMFMFCHELETQFPASVFYRNLWDHAPATGTVMDAYI